MTLLIPEIFGKRVHGFFTGKNPGIDPERLSKIAPSAKHGIYMPVQRHTDRVVIIDSLSTPEIADAVVTDLRGIMIGVQTADCAPILLYDAGRRVIGAVHAGWRGTASGILKKTIRIMEQRFRSSPSDIVAAVGPGIRLCCYRVGREVVDAVDKATGKGDYMQRKDEHYYIDLPTANKYQALSAGVLEENIWVADDCTFCRNDKYYSYRHTGGPAGRQGGFITLL